MLLTGKARLAGVMGWPVSHSLSPRLHGYWFERYGIDGAYIPLPVHPENVALAFQALPRLGFRGWNVTVPHKEAAARLVDELEPAAARIGAVNTVLVQDDGRTRGLNTDGLGFIANLRAQAPAWRPETGPVLLLGAGGAARGIGVALLGAGVPSLRLTNRTQDRAAALAAELAAFGRPVETAHWSQRSEATAGITLLVNCTSLGMVGQPTLEMQLGGCLRRPWWLTWSTCRWRRRCWPRHVQPATRSWTGWACCCTRLCPVSAIGVALPRRSTRHCTRSSWPGSRPGPPDS